MKIGIIGAFDYRNNSMGGQPVKTRQLASTLAKEYGTEAVICLDTHYWKKDIFNVLFGLCKIAFSCKTIIMLPAANGVLYFSRILTVIKKIFRCKLYYSVIGGWLPELTAKDDGLKRSLQSFDGIWVETKHMKDVMNSQGFNNVYVLQNFKKLTRLSYNDLKHNFSDPYDICTFSRVMKEKGIEDAINVVTTINEESKKTIYRLHIYGAVDEGYKEEFDKLCSDTPEYIIYEGVAKPDESVEILRDYFFLLFPTRFFTEGIPGTIIDAYAAGIPVISAKWESYADVIKDGETGICYSFKNLDDLKQIMNYIIHEPHIIVDMKNNCLVESARYTEEEFLLKLKQYMCI